MSKTIKDTFRTFWKNKEDYLLLALSFSFISYILLLIGHLIFQDIGIILSFILLVLPLLIGMKFLIFNAYPKGKISFSHLRVGFMTYSKSIRVYLYSISKPLFNAFIASIGVILVGSIITIVHLASSGQVDLTYSLAYQDVANLIENDSFASLVTYISNLVSIIAFIITFLLYKLNKNFIMYMAFEVPLDSKKAEKLSKEMIKGYYFKYLFSKILISSLLVFPFAAIYYLTNYVLDPEVLTQTTILYLNAAVFFLLAGPVFIFLQINNVVTYKKLSIKYRRSFQKEIDKLVKKIEKMYND